MTTCRIEKFNLPKASLSSEKKIGTVTFGPEDSEKKVYIQAGLHADEPPGYLVAARLIELLKGADRAGKILQRIVIVPAANPIGLSQWGTDTIQGRFDNSDNINFNRRYQNLTEQIAARIDGRLSSEGEDNVRLIRRCAGEILRSRECVSETDYLKNLLLTLSHDADIVLDLHCDYQAVLHMYMGMVQWPQGADLAAQMGAQAILLAEDSGDTPFDEANSKIWWQLAERFPGYPIPPACFAATIELRGVLDTEPHQTEEDAQNLLAFLTRRGYVAGEISVLPPLACDATPLEGVDYACAGTPGILVFLKEPGELVTEGEVIAEIIDPQWLFEKRDGDKAVTQSVTAKSTGILFARSVDRFARPGKIVAKVATNRVLMKKGSYLLTF